MASASGSNKRFQKGKPGQFGHIHLENHHLAATLTLCPDALCERLWGTVLRNPTEPEAEAGHAPCRRLETGTQPPASKQGATLCVGASSTSFLK